MSGCADFWWAVQGGECKDFGICTTPYTNTLQCQICGKTQLNCVLWLWNITRTSNTIILNWKRRPLQSIVLNIWFISDDICSGDGVCDSTNNSRICCNHSSLISVTLNAQNKVCLSRLCWPRDSMIWNANFAGLVTSGVPPDLG